MSIIKWFFFNEGFRYCYKILQNYPCNYYCSTTHICHNICSMSHSVTKTDIRLCKIIQAITTVLYICSIKYSVTKTDIRLFFVVFTLYIPWRGPTYWWWIVQTADVTLFMLQHRHRSGDHSVEEYNAIMKVGHWRQILGIMRVYCWILSRCLKMTRCSAPR